MLGGWTHERFVALKRQSGGASRETPSGSTTRNALRMAKALGGAFDPGRNANAAELGHRNDRFELPMPFPLAHPAAVLPLRRYCPRRLNFPALVIGSICPDVGYCFGRLRLEKFSHRFLAGSFGFCLPVGLLLLLLFYLLRRPLVQRLPAPHRQIYEPLCQRPPGSFPILVVSLLIGVWTHILLDSFTHEDGWLVEHLPVLQDNLLAGNCHVRICDLLYAGCTFAGTACVAWSYLNWLGGTSRTQGWPWPGLKLVAGLVLAALTLLISSFSHSTHPSLGLLSIGVLTTTLVAMFLAATGWTLRNVRR